MKLVIATPLYPPEPGGPATYAKLLEDGLGAHGVEVAAVVKFSEVRNLPRIFRHMAYEKRVRRALKGADAVLALDPVSVGLPAMRAAQKEKKAFFVKIVGDYAWEQGTQRFGITAPLDEFVKTAGVPLPVRVLRRIQTDVAKAATRVIVPSEYLKGVVCAWGIPPETAAVIYNGIALPDEIPAQPKHGAFSIVSAGRRVPWKGFEAIERVAAKHEAEGWRALIISDTPRAETLGCMRAADVFVLNSSYEGLSHVLIEAMTLGTPVIATDAGGNAELVTDGETGLLIPPGDEPALERALGAVAGDRGAAAARARAGQERMKSFSVAHMLEQTADLLKKSV